jgi:hypothetical protein
LGKQLDQAALSNLTPRGVRIQGGQLKRGNRIVTVNLVRIGDMGLTCNVAGTSDDAKAVIEGLVRAYGRVTGGNHDWEYYRSKLALTKFGTATVSQFKAPLRTLLGKPAQELLRLVETDLARNMVPERTGLASGELAFAKVMIHEIDAWVTIVEKDGTTAQCRLDLSHNLDEDVANRRLHVISELDYDSHQRLVQALEHALTSSVEAGALSA